MLKSHLGPKSGIHCMVIFFYAICCKISKLKEFTLKLFLMKNLLMLVFILFCVSFSIANDRILLTDNSVVEGQIVRFGKNKFVVETILGKRVIKNSKVQQVAFDQELTESEKYALGMLDGKRYAQNKGGNIAVGFLFGIVGSAIVYATSDQMPSSEAQLGENKILVDDLSYRQGYSKGARKVSGGNSLIGAAAATALIIAILPETLELDIE